MFTEMETRKYRQKRRAEQAQATRQQIVEAAMHLHETLGPARTSIKAVAEQAGVQRLTVYRHFPDDASLYQACTSHWMSLHPPPAKTAWDNIADPRQRTAKALLAFYRYYSKTSRMWRVAYRDVDDLPDLQGPMQQFDRYLDAVRDDLLSGWRPGKKQHKPLSITLRHGLRFATWQSLKKERLSDPAMAQLVIGWLPGAGGN